MLRIWRFDQVLSSLTASTTCLVVAFRPEAPCV